MTEAPRPEPDASAIEALNRRIDDIAAFQSMRPPWYRDPPVLISASALLISLVTTAVSLDRAQQQDINARKVQLRAAIQQTSNLAMQHMELQDKYSTNSKSRENFRQSHSETRPEDNNAEDNNAKFMNLSSLINTQNEALARESYSLVKWLEDNATSLDLASAAQALSASGSYALAGELLEDAVDRAENAVALTATLRALGGLQYQSGQPQEGSASFQQALTAFDRFPSEAKNRDFVNITQAYTYYSWAAVLVRIDCRLAKEKLVEAGRWLSDFPPDAQQATVIRREVDRLMVSIPDC